MDLVVGFLLLLALPVAGLAWLVTLGMRLRLKEATNRLETLVAARTSDEQAIATLTKRVVKLENALAGREGPAVRRQVDKVAAVPELVGGRTGALQPEPAGVAQSARLALLAARPAEAETISERAPKPILPPEQAAAPADVHPALEDLGELRAEEQAGAPARPADHREEEEPGQKAVETEPKGIVISAESWTGRGESWGAPAPLVPRMVRAEPPAEAEQPVEYEKAAPVEEPQAEREEPSPAGARAAGASGGTGPAEPQGTGPAGREESSAVVPFPGPRHDGVAGQIELPSEEGDGKPGEPPEPRKRPGRLTRFSVPVTAGAPEPDTWAAATRVATTEEAGALSRVLRSGTQAVGRLLSGDNDASRNWETLIGGRWLNLIGIVLLVIGVVLLTQQAFAHLDPLGKIAVGVAFALVMLLGGIWLEHRSAYRRIGSTLVGGGWALLYFDAYAASNIEPVKVIPDARTGLVVMIAVAAGMVGHSLRYRSQFITSVAFGLGYLAVLLTPVSLQSLVASALLAAGLAVVSWAMSWQYLLAGGVIAAYSNHWFWLQKVGAAQAGGPALPLDTPGQGFWISSAILVFYWAIFAAVSLSRRMGKEMSRQLHLSVGVANAVGMLGLITLQLTQGYGGHFLGYLTGPAALGYVVVALGEHRLGERVPFLFAASLALLLYAITLPLLSQDMAIDLAWLAPVLLVGGLAGIAAGIRAAEMLLRAEGLLLAAAAFAQLSLYNLERPGADVVTAVWFATPAMAVAWQVASEWLRRRAIAPMPDLAPAAIAFGVAAALALAHLLWVQVPRDVVGLAWLALGFLALEAGARLPRPVLRLEGYLLAGLALAGLAVAHFAPNAALPVQTLPRPAILLIAAAGFYAMAWRLMAGGWALLDSERRLAWLPSVGGSVLVVAAAVLDLPKGLVCAPLALWSLVLVETGLRRAGIQLRIQGYAVMVCAAGVAALVNAGPVPFGTAPGLQSWGPLLVTLAGLWWLYRRLVLEQPAVGSAEVAAGIAATLVANVLAAELLWKHLPADLVGLAWLAGGILLFEVALRLDRVELRLQAYAVMALAFVLMVAADFSRAWTVAPTASRWLSVGPAVVAYYAFTARLERGAWPRTKAEHALAWVPSALATALVVLLVWFEMAHNLVTAALSAWALLLVEAGLRARRFPIRIQGYVLAALGVLAALRLNGYPAPDGTEGGTGSWGPLLVTVALLWWHFRRFSEPIEDADPLEAWIPEVTSALATLLSAQILLKELPVDTVGLAWLALGLLLFEFSAWIRRPAVRFEGYVLQGMAVAAFLLVNCGTAFLSAHGTAPRWALLIPGIAGLYYSTARLLSSAAGVTERETLAGWLPSACATILVAALAILDLPSGLLAGAFSLWGLVLAEAGLHTRQVTIRLQGHVLVASAAVLAFAVNLYGFPAGFGGAPTSGPTQWIPVFVTTVVLTWLFVRLSVRPAAGAAAFEFRLGEWASCATSLLLALLAWKELPSLAVAILWCALGFATFQISQALHSLVLRAQAHILLGAAYLRLYMANFVVLEQAGPISLRLVTVLPVLLALYCVLDQLRATEPDGRPGLLGRIRRLDAEVVPLFYSWAGFLGLVVLFRFEFGREHTVAAWSALVLLFLVLGEHGDRPDFRFQSYGLAIYAVVRAWATNLHMDGTWAHMPERISTTLPMIAVLFISAIAVARRRTAKPREGRSRLVRLFDWLDERSHTLFALLASAFTALLLYYQLDVNTLSIGLALEGFCLLALGLVINARAFRWFGLGLLLVCLVKLMVYDLRGVEVIYRIMSFIVLGLVLLLASFGYARYRDKIEKLI